MKGFERFRNVLFLACLTATALAQQVTAPPPREHTLDDAVVQGERERERRPSPTSTASNPDVVTVTRDREPLARLRLQFAKQEIRFRRESTARLPVSTKGAEPRLTPGTLSVDGMKSFRDASIELASGIDEADGLPATIPFGPRSSLVNIDYLRMIDSKRPTLINVRNVIDPQTRRCEPQGGWADDGLPFSNRFLFVSDTLNDCKSALQERHGDLLVADGIPEQLREDVFEVFDPIFARLSSRLGSEPGLIYVAWWAESPRSDVRFELSWNRSALLLFNGARWQEGISPDQKNELRESFTREQIQRRIREIDWPGTFTTSAASYLQLLARSEQDKNTSRRLAADLPVWIARCSGRLDGRPVMTGSQPDVPGNDCGRLLQFVYDAAARAGSDGQKTVFDTWRQLLKESSSARKSGVLPADFMATSSDGKRITQGLTQGSMNWAKFAEDLARLGVQLQIRQDQLGVTAQVLSLKHFRDP